MFLGYSIMSKSYKCLNKVVDTKIESENVRIDEFAYKNNEKRKKEPKDYNIFVYIQDGVLDNLPKHLTKS